MFLFCLLFLMILFVSMMLFFIGFIISMKSNFVRMKSSPFECGFEGLSSMRLPFSIHFYLIAILFLVFDIEIIYLFSMNMINFSLNFKVWFLSVMMILIILYLGLEYEKFEGLIEWMV